MNKELTIFRNEEFGEVRTSQDGDKVLFCGSDVAKALGYKDTVNALKQHCREDGVVFHHITDSLGRKQQAKFINEGNVYRLISKSKLPSAEKFETWVFDEVLPQIRQTGGYIPIHQDESKEEFLARAFIIASETLKKKDEIIALREKQIEERKPLVEFANHVSNTSNLIDMGKMAKLLKDEHIDIGRNRLFEWLRAKKILMRNNTPYQKYIDNGYFQVKESITETAYGSKVFVTTYVTGKGQIYITEQLRKEFSKAS